MTRIKVGETVVKVGETVVRKETDWQPRDLELGDIIRVEGDGYEITGKVKDFFVDGLHTPSVFLEGINGRQHLIDNVAVTVLYRPTPVPRPGMRIRNDHGIQTIVMMDDDDNYHIMDARYTVSDYGWTKEQVAKLFEQRHWTLVD